MRYKLLAYFTLCFLHTFAQQELNFPEVRYGTEHIKANWVSHPDIHGGEDRIILFRKEISVAHPDEDFIINITADNHYFLYVNGTFVTHGPQLGDLKHWRFETLNLKNFLVKGKNTIAVKVVNYGKKRFLGIQSLYTSLMVNGVTDNAKMLATKGPDDGWKCMLDNAYQALEVHWRSQGENRIIGGFYANNPTDYVDMNHHIRGWELPGFDDAEWQSTAFYESASSMGGSIAYLLEPRNVPLLGWEKEPVGVVVRATTTPNTDFPVSGTLQIPPNTKATFLLDKKEVTTGFPELHFDGGANASIKIKYAENLFGPDQEKGDRNEIQGKELVGYLDHIISSGEQDQKFIPTWMRTFRFIEFQIETGDEGLVLKKFHNNRSLTTISTSANFTSNNETYNQIFDICMRTVALCTQDYFLSDAYYETMQYVGDTKIHALIWQALSGNLAHTENALQQFHQSRDAEGNLLGAYPLRSTFIFPTYSLIWVDMVADYYSLTGDTSVIEKYKGGILHTLQGFEKNMKDNDLVDKTRYRYFVDWYQNPENGGGTATKNGGENSAVVSLHYARTLSNAANLFTAIGDTYQATQCTKRASEIKKAVYERCYDTERKLFAERPDKSVFDQHTNIMAILTDAIAPEKQEALLVRLLEEEDLLQATYYYRFYLFEAIKKVGKPELFHLAQKPWERMIYENMTTTLERFESTTKPTRSEAHPWSASPAYFYLTYLAGIQSKKHNFEEIRIAPAFGKLNTIKGTLPTPRGNIHFNLKKKGKRLLAEIEIPATCKGEIVWNGATTSLRPGKQQLELK